MKLLDEFSKKNFTPLPKTEPLFSSRRCENIFLHNRHLRYSSNNGFNVLLFHTHLIPSNINKRDHCIRFLITGIQVPLKVYCKINLIKLNCTILSPIEEKFNFVF